MVLTRVSRHCTVLHLGRCIVPVMPNSKGLFCNFICQILPVALIAPQDFKEIMFLERISASTIDCIHKCKILKCKQCILK